MMDISSKSSFKFDKLKYQLYQNKYRSMIRDYQLPKNRDFKENNYSRNEGSMFKRNFRKPPNYNSYENERPQYSPENLTTLLIDCVKKKLS